MERGIIMTKKMKSSLPAAKKTRPAKAPPTHEEIALRAYEIHLERGGAPGYALEDWLRAESELMERNSKPRGKMGPTLVAA